MNELLEKLGPEKWLELNIKLQQKKSNVRKKLKEKGVVQKDKTNIYDKYSYFSEAGYKKLFTELFSENSLELSTNEVEYQTYQTNNQKMQNGRIVKFEFTLTDTETGFFETTNMSGEGMDKGDKAGYKADTGALKYYLANTFMVATGDDAENESPEATSGYSSRRTIIDEQGREKSIILATLKQVEIIMDAYKDYPEKLQNVLGKYGVKAVRELSKKDAEDLIVRLESKGE